MNGFSRQLVLHALFLPVLFLSAGVHNVFAGFGITPPYVNNSSLTRNAVYEQKILLVRGDTDIAQKAEVVVDAPEIQDWIEIVEGDEIMMPVGKRKTPMTVRVRVPSDAEFKEYSGHIRVRTLPADDELLSGSVNISLGAIIDIDLTVIDREIRDFRIRKVSVGDLNEGKEVGWLFFPGKIRFDIMLENTGNIDISPSEVEFRIFDRQGRVLLEQTTNIGKIDTVQPYLTDTVTAELPTRLPAGGYIARYRINNGDEIKQEGDILLNIKPAGTLNVAGFGFAGLSLPHKISVLLPIFALIIAILYFLHARRRKYRKS